jgi:hypothetical protein
MPLTDHEKSRVRLHLGYPLQQANAGLTYGEPINLQSSFLIDRAFGLVSEVSCDMIRKYLQRLDEIEEDLHENREALLARSMEDLQLAPDYMQKMQALYETWQVKLAQILYVPVNPNFSGLGRPLRGPGVRNLAVD